MISLIVAYDQNRGIGRDGELLWKPGEMREDMARFRTLTRDTTVILGRRTLESIGMALPHRRNIVVSSRTVEQEGVETARSVDDAFALSGNDETFVIGGATVYEQALHRAKRIYATEVKASIDGADTYFPTLDSEWTETERAAYPADGRNIHPYDFVTYERTFLNIANVRSDDQREVFESIERSGECPFCGDNFEKLNPEILRRGENWTLAPNRWPYENTETHLIAVPTYHAETLADLRDGSFDELLSYMKWAEKEFDVKAGGIAMRFGDARFNGSSVKHLHAHLIVPSRDKPADVKVRFKIS